MRCCLINPLYGLNSLISYSPPLGLAYIGAILEKNGHEVKIIDRVVLRHHDDISSLEYLDKTTGQQICDFKPELIGIGAMTIQVYDMYHTADLIRKLPNGKNYLVVAGGFHPTAETELTLRQCPGIDVVCRGEGEFAMLELASGKRTEDVAGLAFEKDKKVFLTEDREPSANLDILSYPARHLLDMDFYSCRSEMVIPNLPLKVATVVTSRGCPYDCKFCANKLIYRSVRAHSLEYVMGEIEVIIENYKVEAISFVDTMFLLNRKRLEEICREFIKRGLNRKLKWACSLRANLVDEAILGLMKEAGCIYVNYGFESGSQRMLDLMNKKASVSENYKAAMITNQAGILVNSAMIVGLPGETEEDILATIDFLKKTKVYCSSLNILLPLPGSPYYTEFLNTGLLVHSENLWKEIGALPGSLEEIRTYSRMPRKKFEELYTRVCELIAFNNASNYIQVNWYKHPISSLKRLPVLLRYLLLKKKTTDAFSF